MNIQSKLISRTPITRLPWLIRIRFLSPSEILSIASGNLYLRKFSYFILKLHVEYELKLHQGDNSNEYTQHNLYVRWLS